MTPYELKILIDVYVGTPLSVSIDAPIFPSTSESLIQLGYMASYGDEPRPFDLLFYPTDKLRCLMNHILALPEPQWQMPAREGND